MLSPSQLGSRCCYLAVSGFSGVGVVNEVLLGLSLSALQVFVSGSSWLLEVSKARISKIRLSPNLITKKHCDLKIYIGSHLAYDFSLHIYPEQIST